MRAAAVRAIARAALAAALVLAGCAPAPQRTATPVASPYAATQLPFGTWVVVGHYAVGPSPLTRQEADAWLRREARYSSAVAGFAPDTCLVPVYAARSMSLSELAIEYGVRPEDLLLQATRVQVIEVRCRGPWNAPGSRLIVLGPNRLNTYWQGTMLELARK